jgi:hypothetical protein
VELPFLSDHAPIMLHLDSSPNKIDYPFKLNSDWLNEDGFNSIVFVVWPDPLFLSKSCIQLRVIWKLRSPKACIKAWATSYMIHNTQILYELEYEI